MPTKKLEDIKYYIYYKDCDFFVAWDSETDEIKKMKYKDMNLEYNWYKMLKYGGCESTPEGLRQYVKLFHDWHDEIVRNKILNVNWLSYKNNNWAVQLTFRRLAKGLYEDHDPIERLEANWMEKCFNSGIMQLDSKYEMKPFNGYGYDFKFCHPTVLACKNLLIPTKSGKEYTLTELPEINKIKVGYYAVKITCKNEQFKKLFSFSKDNVYTDRSLYHALKHQKEFNIKIQLIQNGKPNAYIYDSMYLTTGKKIFGNWFTKIFRLKKMFPKNGLVKHLGSSLSGELARKRKTTKTYDEIEKEKLDVGINGKHDYEFIDEKHREGEDVRVIIRDNKSPFIYNIRYQPFLHSFVRNKVARVAYPRLNHVVRVYADSLIFSKPHEFKEFDLFPEEKSTGLLLFKKANQKIDLSILEYDTELINVIKSRANICK